ncbi:hypothetical protein LUZ63_017132 [Rhynchospora breviuscula]|uniref:Phytocyanin domain-containing protein n=1 Tax=Rhynchospora breviuscula TaxID=2022672 RepID=A0A9Q0C1X4_9POAL|nr:hypothetical protein LUZ63_017132 [Rhynchospora breviuscula]
MTSWLTCLVPPCVATFAGATSTSTPPLQCKTIHLKGTSNCETMKQHVSSSMSLRWRLPLILVVISLTLLQQPILVPATLFRVGGPMGWTVPPSPDFYQTWASSHNYTIGDILEFSYTGPSSLQNVRKEEYHRCHSSHPIYNFSDGMTVFGLFYSGSSYFISSDFHSCKKGQRLAVRVLPLPPTPKRRRSPPPSSSHHGAWRDSSNTEH